MPLNNDAKSIADFSNLSQLLNQKQFAIKYLNGVPRLSVTNWQRDGILDKPISKDLKWRKFSLVDILWISIIAELRAFGYSIPNILKVKNQLFSIATLENNQEIPLLEHCLVEIITYGVPKCLVLTKDANFIQITDDVEYAEFIQSENFQSHILLNLNHSIKENINPLYQKPELQLFAILSPQEQEVISIIRKKSYQSIKITKKNGDIDLIEGVQRIDTTQKIVDLLKEGEFQNIEVKQSNGKIVCINRTIKKKINKKP